MSLNGLPLLSQPSRPVTRELRCLLSSLPAGVTHIHTLHFPLLCAHREDESACGLYSRTWKRFDFVINEDELCAFFFLFLSQWIICTHWRYTSRYYVHVSVWVMWRTSQGRKEGLFILPCYNSQEERSESVIVDFWAGLFWTFLLFLRRLYGLDFLLLWNESRSTQHPGHSDWSAMLDFEGGCFLPSFFYINNLVIIFFYYQMSPDLYTTSRA